MPLVADAPYLYVQATGKLYLPSGAYLATGYSGRGEGFNAPQMQQIHNVGPIPCGMYTLGKPVDHPMLGPIAIPLQPNPANNMHGRSAFYVHGDNREHNGTASEGCIIMPRMAREVLSKGGTLKVIDKEAVQEVAT